MSIGKVSLGIRITWLQFPLELLFKRQLLYDATYKEVPRVVRPIWQKAEW